MKIVYPLETKKRELDGALLLASELVALGHEVYLGPKRELNYQVDTIKPDVFIASNAGYSLDYKNLYQYLFRSNCKICVIDTEGGVILEELYKKRHDSQMLDFCHYFFAWGQKGKELINEGTGFPLNKIKVTGVPWFDILTNYNLVNNLYSEEYNEIVDQYGNDLILYNSRFGGVNVHNSEVKSSIKREGAKQEYFEHSTRLFNLLNKALDTVVKIFPEKKIIIRPHPSENKDFYTNRFKEYQNVFVDDRFSVRPWILASKTMFHNGCTTAIEAALMNITPIAYMPIQSKKYDIHLPNNISEQTFNEEQLIDAINKKYLNGDKKAELSQNQVDNLNNYIANITTKSCKVIAKHISTIESVGWKARPTKEYYLQKVKAYLLNNHINKIKPISQKKFEKLNSFREYGLKKFPTISLDEINQQLNLLQQRKLINIKPLERTKDCFVFTKNT